MNDTRNVEWMSVNDIIPYNKNPRKNEKAVAKVAKSIKEFGFNQPIVVDKDRVIVVGHTRLKGALHLGMDKVPVMYMPDSVSDEKVQAYRIADNKLNELAEWDNDLLLEEIMDLNNTLDDIELTGFDTDDIQTMLDNALMSEEEKENQLPYLKEIAKTQTGDVWVCGEHRVVCGDSTDPANWEILLEGEKMKCVFTSPPYNMGGSAGSGLYDEYNDNKGSAEYLQFNRNIVDSLKPYLKGFLFYNISYNANCRWEFIDVLADIKEKLKFLELIVWRKLPHGTPVGGNRMIRRDYEDIAVYADEETYEDVEWYAVMGTHKEQAFVKRTAHKMANLWEVSVWGGIHEDNHSAAFPVELPLRGIKLTTHKNDIVGDPFGGTGTTMISCEKSDRRARLIEMSPIYVDMIVERWQRYTGKKAYRQSDNKLYDDVHSVEGDQLQATFNLDRMDISDAFK